MVSLFKKCLIASISLFCFQNMGIGYSDASEQTQKKPGVMRKAAGRAAGAVAAVPGAVGGAVVWAGKGAIRGGQYGGQKCKVPQGEGCKEWEFRKSAPVTAPLGAVGGAIVGAGYGTYKGGKSAYGKTKRAITGEKKENKKNKK